MSKKSLGFFSILALVLGTMVGVGILITPTLMCKYGVYGFMAWPIASALCLSLAIMFSKLSGLVSASGPAGYAHEAFGNLASFQVSWAHWIGFTAAQSIITYSFGQYVSPLFASLGFSDISLYISLGGLWLITFLSSFMTIFSISSILILTSIKVSMLLVIIIAGLPYLSISKIAALPSLLADQTPTASLMAAVSICLLSFIGLEMATLPSDNVKNPKVTIPLATIVGTIIAAILYTFSYAIVGSAFTPEFLNNTTKPMYEAARLFLGDYAGYCLIFCAGLGFIASINGVLFAQSYIIKYASAIKILPKCFHTESRAGFPVYAGLLSATVSSIVILCISCNPSIIGIIGAFSACFVSIAYLWAVASFRHLGGNVILWGINFITALCFLAGSLTLDTIPYAVLMYCFGFFVYGCFVTNKKLTAF